MKTATTAVVAVPDHYELSPVEPIETSVTPGDQGAVPMLRWISVGDLRINRGYQRSLSEGSRRLIRLMVEHWNWSHVKALSVFACAGETFEVFDGQHTAIAAATRGDVDKLPCLVSSSRSQAEAARDFVSLNTNRLALTPTQLFQAKLVAGDALASQVAEHVAAGGGRILRNPTPAQDCKPGDTVALGILAQMVKEGDAELISQIVRLAITAEIPLSSAFAKGARVLLAGPENWRLGERAIVAAVKACGMKKLQRRARDLKDKFPLSAGEATARAIREAAGVWKQADAVKAAPPPRTRIVAPRRAPADVEIENEELREQVRQLKASFLNSEWLPPAELKLTVKEARVVALLAGRAEMCSKQQVMDALYGLLPDSDEPMEKIVDVFVCKARRKLKPFDVSIETVWGRGYRMPVESRAKLHAMVAEAA